LLNAEAGCAAFSRVMEHVADQTLSREETKNRALVAMHQSQAAAAT
jgi:hypothetical protein